MRLRRAGSLVLALALAACTKVTQNEQPASFVFASFNSDTGAIPLPNDLALQAVPSMVVTATNLRGAQKELLQAFIDGGGFPNDQEVPVTIPFNTVTWSETAVNPVTGFAGNYVAGAPPALDLATVTSTTVVLKRVDGEAADVPYEASYDAVKGVLTLRKVAGANGRRWDAGARYVVAVRGGPNGVKTTDGQEISPDSAIGLVSRNVDLSLAANRPPKTPAFTAAEIAKLEGLRKVLWNPLPWCRISGTWNPPINPATGTVTPALCSTTPGVPSASAFAAAGMPADEVATLATFGVAPASGTVALIDAGSGVAPLPIDLLRTTAPATAGGPYTVDLNDGFGPLKAGLATLDGFSTTAMLLAQTSDPGGRRHGERRQRLPLQDRPRRRRRPEHRHHPPRAEAPDRPGPGRRGRQPVLGQVRGPADAHHHPGGRPALRHRELPGHRHRRLLAGHRPSALGRRAAQRHHHRLPAAARPGLHLRGGDHQAGQGHARQPARQADGRQDRAGRRLRPLGRHPRRG